MSRMEQREVRKKKLGQFIILLLCMGVGAYSLVYVEVIKNENDRIKELINNSREVPLSIKEELNLR